MKTDIVARINAEFFFIMLAVSEQRQHKKFKEHQKLQKVYFFCFHVQAK